MKTWDEHFIVGEKVLLSYLLKKLPAKTAIGVEVGDKSFMPLDKKAIKHMEAFTKITHLNTFLNLVRIKIIK